MPATSEFAHKLSNFASYVGRSDYTSKSRTSDLSSHVGGPVITSATVALDLSTFDPLTSNFLTGHVTLVLAKDLLGIGKLVAKVYREQEQVGRKIQEGARESYYMVNSHKTLWECAKDGRSSGVLYDIKSGPSIPYLPAGTHTIPFQYPWLHIQSTNRPPPPSQDPIIFRIYISLTRDPLTWLPEISMSVGLSVQQPDGKWIFGADAPLYTGQVEVIEEKSGGRNGLYLSSGGGLGEQLETTFCIEPTENGWEDTYMKALRWYFVPKLKKILPSSVQVELNADSLDGCEEYVELSYFDRKENSDPPTWNLVVGGLDGGMVEFVGVGGVKPFGVWRKGVIYSLAYWLQGRFFSSWSEIVIDPDREDDRSKREKNSVAKEGKIIFDKKDVTRGWKANPNVPPSSTITYADPARPDCNDSNNSPPACELSYYIRDNVLRGKTDWNEITYTSVKIPVDKILNDYYKCLGKKARSAQIWDKYVAPVMDDYERALARVLDVDNREFVYNSEETVQLRTWKHVVDHLRMEFIVEHQDCELPFSLSSFGRPDDPRKRILPRRECVKNIVRR
ncbi:hypothetical protein HK097_000282 [Rhizophlyctis rosea]|uniref:Uncharacterized protein n=1 Tax=Rhizophlyctis rosea TaxID=64517 RepID=A0AAD5WYY4_9FUNG|nr:hypothetical protein HK097_000282 [Rhizophlyctis rosea]